MVEPSALPVTAMVATFMSANSLFLVFPPVYVLAMGEPVEALALYYPLYGVVTLVSQLVAGRVSDRLGRATTVRLGSALAIGGLAVAIAWQGILALAVAGAGYGLAVSLVSPTMSALTIDRAPPDRIGAAMATYSVGYGMAVGVSSVLWGAVIALVGFPWPFALAIGLQVLTIILTFRFAEARLKVA
jgi:MFS family permease